MFGGHVRLKVIIKRMVFSLVYFLSPIIVSVVYWIEEPLTYPEPFDLAHRIGSILGIVSFIWMCFNIIIVTRIKAIESSFGLEFLHSFHMHMASIALIMGSLHYPLLRIGGELDTTQTRTGNLSWASFVLLLILAIIFMSNALIKKLGKFRTTAYKKRFRYRFNKVLHNFLILSVSMVFAHTMISFTSVESVIMKAIYMFFFGITLLSWFYHKIIRRFRANKDPYHFRRASWDGLTLEELSLRNKKWVLSILKQNPSLYPCLQCGECAKECPVSSVTNGAYNPRRNILATLFGYKDLLFEEDDLVVWGCTDCHSCEEVCPQHIELTDLFGYLKNHSISLGKGPAYIIEQARTIFNNAKAIPSQPALERRRQELGLPPLLEPDLNEVQALLKNLGLKEKLEVE